MLQSERLLTKLTTLCRRVHGPDHRLTLKAEMYLQECKVRYVMVNHQLEWKTFEALRYEEDGEVCVVKGPINEQEEVETFAVFTNGASLFYKMDGTPVVCHGLKSATHLNGKIGDLRSRDRLTGRYKVHFEDKNLEPRMIKRENIRILFELPESRS